MYILLTLTHRMLGLDTNDEIGPYGHPAKEGYPIFSGI